MKVIGYKEYTQQLSEEFPDVDKEAIERVVRHGLAMIGFFRKTDNDVYINNNVTKNYYYFGKVTITPQSRLANHRKKARKKLRLVYNLNKVPFSGYCYFGLTEEQYQQHLLTHTIDKAYLWRIEDEAKVYEKAKYFFRVPVTKFKSWCITQENYETNNAEFLYSRAKDGPKSTYNPK